MSKPKVYFACSIAAANINDRSHYATIINALKKHCEVSTELFADDEQLNKIEVSMTDEEIFNRDVRWLNEADAVVAEVSKRSHGVGFELGMMSGKKPILCLYKKEEYPELSAMIGGNKAIIVREYKSITDLPTIFDEFFTLLHNKGVA